MAFQLSSLHGSPFGKMRLPRKTVKARCICRLLNCQGRKTAFHKSMTSTPLPYLFLFYSLVISWSREPPSWLLLLCSRSAEEEMGEGVRVVFSWGNHREEPSSDQRKVSLEGRKQGEGLCSSCSCSTFWDGCIMRDLTVVLGHWKPWVCWPTGEWQHDAGSLQHPSVCGHSALQKKAYLGDYSLCRQWVEKVGDTSLLPLAQQEQEAALQAADKAAAWTGTMELRLLCDSYFFLKNFMLMLPCFCLFIPLYFLHAQTYIIFSDWNHRKIAFEEEEISSSGEKPLIPVLGAASTLTRFQFSVFFFFFWNYFYFIPKSRKNVTEEKNGNTLENSEAGLHMWKEWIDQLRCEVCFLKIPEVLSTLPTIRHSSIFQQDPETCCT